MTLSARLDATFAALADPTRRAILDRLAGGDASVTELAKPFAMSQPAISKHIKVLERAGLIARGAWLEGYRRRRTTRRKGQRDHANLDLHPIRASQLSCIAAEITSAVM